MKELLMPYGENGITFTLFNELNSEEKLRRLLINIDWFDRELNKKLSKEKIDYVYLFPCFGKGSGPGEPDAIIITKNYNIFIELETEELDKKLEKHLNNQITRFIEMGIDLQTSKKKKVSILEGYLWKTEGINGKKTKGKFRNRKIFMDLLKGKKSPLFVIITEDKNDAGKKLFQHFNKDAEKLGFMNYHRIKKMKGLSKTTRVINFNIKG